MLKLLYVLRKSKQQDLHCDSLGSLKGESQSIVLNDL